MQIAETERLILRQYTVDDAKEFYRIYTDPINMKFMGRMPDSLEFEREHIQKHIDNYYNKYGFGLWATILKRNNKLIGRCGLLYQEIEGTKDLELAYLLDWNYWGRGLATEAAEVSIKLGFEEFNFTRIIAVINPQNVASIRVAEKVGLSYEREIASFKDFGKVSMYSLILPATKDTNSTSETNLSASQN
ncbi:MAG: GNAT family N-acetyltransferase [Acidobacteriota bacterium]|nr:GNAT family N-acetyltransferase [Acidobacteriota bacterium]